MTALPAYCPNCHSIFPFHRIALGDGATVGVENIATNCPVCGFVGARISDGIYRATQQAVELLSGPESSRAMLEALQAVAERLKAGEISKEQAKKEAEAASRRYGALLDLFSPHGIAALTLLITLIGLYLQYESTKSSEETTKKIVDAITEQTFVIKDIADKQRVERQRATPSNQKTKPKSSTVRRKLKRRTEVYKERRTCLKQKRLTFGGARTH
jgi:hypothetical protein